MLKLIQYFSHQSKLRQMFSYDFNSTNMNLFLITLIITVMNLKIATIPIFQREVRNSKKNCFCISSAAKLIEIVNLPPLKCKKKYLISFDQYDSSAAMDISH